jgi:hypothetical protein
MTKPPMPPLHWSSLRATWFLVPALTLLNMARLPAGPAVQAWVRHYSSWSGSPATPTRLAVSPGAQVYVTGASENMYHRDGCATVAYSASGTPLWTNRYDDVSTGTGVAVDRTSGNVYVCAAEPITPYGVTFATLAYSSTGARLWTNTYADPYYSGGGFRGIGVDDAGRVYVAGSAGGMAAHYVTVAYSAAGTPLWTNTYSGPNSVPLDQARDMAVDKQGDVYVTGCSMGASGSIDYATVAYSSNGSGLWTNRYTSGGAYALALDAENGNVYVTGYGAVQGTYMYATIAYSRTGVPLWTNTYQSGTSTYDQGWAVAVGNGGNVYVTGPAQVGCITIAYSRAGTPLWTNLTDGVGVAVTLDTSGHVIVASTCWDYGSKLLAYSSTGTPLWTNRYDADEYRFPEPHCLGAGPAGSYYVTGEGSLSDYFTAKFVPSPDILFTHIDPLADGTTCLALTAPTNVGYRLEASTDLKAWETLTNFPPLPVTSIQYTDALAPHFPRRFYRTVWSP